MQHNPDPYETRALAVRENESDPDPAITLAMVYVGDQVGELVMAAASDKIDQEAQRAASLRALGMVCAGVVGVAALVAGIVVDSGGGFIAAAIAVVALIIIGAVSEAGR